MNAKDAVVGRPARYGMKLMLLACLLSGCTDPARQKIVGEWEMETADKLTDRLGDSETAQPSTVPLTVRFQGNGRLTTTTRMGNIDSTKTGTWKLVSDEDQLTVLECVLGDPKTGFQTTELKLDWLDEDRLRMTPPNMAGVTLKFRFSRKR